ncbi:alpha/beta hydrolase [Acidithiobacillus sp. IBUN Pt1247-S3]|uniref:alpha/beta hydrolase n=1 Tax=Acidithiobacillus sp. IBUN Pt1247-S3 TaxID=3166642 RepID=UPI0034E3E321
MNDLRIETADHVTIEADWYPASQPCCILAHGKAYEKGAWQDLAGHLQDWGWSSIAVNFRGYGASERGDGTSFDQDLVAAINYASARQAKPLVLLGASMGGAVVLKALATSETSIDAAVLLSPAGGAEYMAAVAGKISSLQLLFSRNEEYAAIARDIALRSPCLTWLRQWPGILHAHRLLDDPHTGSAVRECIHSYLDFCRQSLNSEEM